MNRLQRQKLIGRTITLANGHKTTICRVYHKNRQNYAQTTDGLHIPTRNLK